MNSWVEIAYENWREKIRDTWGRFTERVSFTALLTIRQIKALIRTAE